MPEAMPHPEFDTYAEAYEEALRRGLSLAGEDGLYFAEGRVAWLRDRLRALGIVPRTALDFGCGTGNSAPILLRELALEAVVGVDVSTSSLAVAARRVRDPRARFCTLADYSPAGSIDLAFSNGVFHHIKPAERAVALDYVWRALRPGGWFALWENNPWNPGTRLIMSRVEFDRDAITLPPPETRRRLIEAGFAIERTDFLFIFPHWLRALRGLEPALAGLPLGGQYLVLARKPEAVGKRAPMP